MRGSVRITFISSIVATLILWHFINIHREFLVQRLTQVSGIQTSKNTQALTIDWSLLHDASSTEQAEATATKNPATSVDFEDVDQESPIELPSVEQDETSNQPGLKRGELVMIVGSSGNSGYLGVPGIREMVYENRMSYADRWGHEFMWANISSYDFSKANWNKIPIIQEAHTRYPKAKWFWWLDFDAIIVNGSLNIYDHMISPTGITQSLLFDANIPQIGGGLSRFRTPATMDPDSVNMLIAIDSWGINTGSFLMRRSEWTDMVLEMWADPLAVEKGWIFSDQDRFVHTYQHHEFVRKHTGIVKQRTFNSYAESNPLGAHWQSGDFVVHFPGCGATNDMTRCHNNRLSYWEDRDNYTTPDWILRQIQDGTTLIESVQQGKP